MVIINKEVTAIPVYKYLFTQDSVYNMGYQEFIEPLWGTWDIYGQSTFNVDGNRYATSCDASGIWSGKIFLADFDRCYGILTNPKVIIQCLKLRSIQPKCTK